MRQVRTPVAGESPHRLLRRGAVLGIALVAVVGLVTGCEEIPGQQSAGGAGTDVTTPDLTVTGDDAAAAAAAAAGTKPASALGSVALLTVKGRAPKTGYTRDQFGPAWQDVDHNGCDTRNDVLRRDLTEVVATPGTHDCVVTSGVLADPYSGRTITFTRGQDTSSAVQIDHVVALSDAWQKGAQQWDAGRRAALGNDPLNLLAADGPLNAQKGDGDTATWLPPNKAIRCAYAVRFAQVSIKYQLPVTTADKSAMLKECGG